MQTAEIPIMTCVHILFPTGCSGRHPGVTPSKELGPYQTVFQGGKTGDRSESFGRVVLACLFCSPYQPARRPSPLWGETWGDESAGSRSRRSITHRSMRCSRNMSTGEGNVDYAAWQKSRADRKSLLGYLAQLSRASRKSRAGPRLASRVLDQCLQCGHDRRNSAGLSHQQHPQTTLPVCSDTNIWKETSAARSAAPQYSLEHMEHQILRKMNEPRIHFAIVCASISCPKLHSEAYTPSKVQSQLAANTRDFFGLTKNTFATARPNGRSRSARF